MLLGFCRSEIIFNHIMIQKYVVKAVEGLKMYLIIAAYQTVQCNRLKKMPKNMKRRFLM